MRNVGLKDLICFSDQGSLRVPELRQIRRNRIENLPRKGISVGTIGKNLVPEPGE